MCDVCIPVLGAAVEKHQKEQCCLLQGMVCPRCGPRTHAPSRCPVVNPKKLTSQPIPSLKPEPRSKRPYSITNTNEAFLEYIKNNTLVADKNIHKNRLTVTAHLSRIGCIPVYPPEPLEASIPAALTECGHRHGGNEMCMKQKRQQPQKARATK
jgi:hypothetical protein